MKKVFLILQCKEDCKNFLQCMFVKLSEKKSGVESYSKGSNSFRSSSDGTEAISAGESS